MEDSEEYAATLGELGRAHPAALHAREHVRAQLFGEARPVHIGRFALVEEIGRGAMGVVYSAYDAELDRRVAIKVLDDSEALFEIEGPSTSRHRRLVREAQAIARVTHPNVVTVYEVGTDRGRVFIAMEYVEGQPLSRWATSERSWREVVTVYVQAGRGLAAAHAAGLVHRDFKPDNVLVGSDGRPRVVDFGLARPEAMLTDRGAETGQTREGNKDQTPVTGIAGTPAYMAPEVFDGDPPNSFADQYSFCASLWESLFGTRPFRGESLMQLYAAKREGLLHGEANGRDVPRSLRAIVTRGLSPDPQDRFASMHALIRALEQSLAARRRRMLGAGAVALLAAASAVGYSTATTKREPRCANIELEFDASWNETTRQRLADAIRRHGSALSADTATRVVDLADAYASEWSTMRREACEATHVRGTQSERFLDLRMLCLDGHRAAFDAQIEVLGRDDSSIVEHAVLAMTRLPAVSNCGDLERLSAAVALPQEPASVEVLETLESVRALTRAGMTAEAHERVQSLLEPARATESPIVVARTLHEAGKLATDQGEHARSRELLTEAWWAALDGRDDDTATAVATVLVAVEGLGFARYEAARSWGAQAEAAIRRHRLGRELEVALWETLGSIAISSGDLEEAKVQLERALQHADGVSAPLRARILSRLALVVVEAGEYDEAQQLSQRAWDLSVESLGPHHPQTAARKVRHASVLYSRNAYAEAEALLVESIREIEAARGEGNKGVGDALNLLGAVLEAQSRYEEALETYDRALVIYRQILGTEHPDYARTLDNSTGSLTGLRRFQESQARKEEALAVLERTTGPESPEVATSLGGLANTLRLQGRYAEAVELLERANAIWSQHASDHPVLALNFLELAHIAGLEQRWNDALAWSRRALEIREAHGAGSLLLAEARLWVGMSLWKLGGHRAEARDVLRLARLGYTTKGLESKLEGFDAWLESEGIDLD